MALHHSPSMHVWTHHRWRFPLPPRHKFPLPKYALLAERVVADGLARPDEVHEPDPAEWADLAAVHDAGLLARIREGRLTVREERGLGLPWSPELVERGRRAVAGTIAAAHHALDHGVAMNLGGGTHHAGRDFARGYCLFNDVAIALGRLRARGAGRAGRSWSTATSTRATARRRSSPRTSRRSRCRCTARATTRSRACPSDLDVDIASGTGDERLSARAGARRSTPRSRGRAPTWPSTSAGADPWHGDRLGRLSAQQGGSRAPATRSCSTGSARSARRSASCSAGGYAEDVRDTVDINAATAAAVARARAVRRTRPFPVRRDRTAKPYHAGLFLQKVRGEARQALRPYVAPTSGQPPPLPSPGAGGTTPSGAGVAARLRFARAPGGVVLTGTHRPCMPELGVRFPSPPLAPAGVRSRSRSPSAASARTTAGRGPASPRGSPAWPRARPRPSRPRSSAGRWLSPSSRGLGGGGGRLGVERRGSGLRAGLLDPVLAPSGWVLDGRDGLAGRLGLGLGLGAAVRTPHAAERRAPRPPAARPPRDRRRGGA